MKKTPALFSLIFAGVAVFAASSCASTKNSLDAGNSKELKIVLEGNETTGYSWENTLTNEEIVSIKEKVTYLGKDGITGAPSKFEYSVKALKDGTTDLTFVYKRPFEADKALDTIVYKIEVKNGEILAQGTIEGKWRINSFYKNDEAQAICDVVLNLKKEKDDFFVSGEAGVNIFNGNIKLSENIGNGEGGFAMTRMMGPADAMSFEHEYIQLFNGEFYVIPAVKNGTEILTIANLKNGLSAEYRLVKEPLVERQ
ncbi:protease inhibitor I42 family protein [Treponema sp. UBA7567]|uniref:protease inhibitor I42 family protein n=1 Tax=Treponema sp. UBA7567 TaxID=1947748 RepID=UPI0025FB726A|nr:protease inhibitor I42 family protein [Treponema sp. UBA7567]